VIVEEAPPLEKSSSSRPWQLLTLSAKTAAALETAGANLAEYFSKHPDLNLADAAFTLQVGRQAFSHRRVLVCQSLSEAIAALRAPDSGRLLSSVRPKQERAVVFMFTGQGAQYVNMGRELYEAEPTFREQIDRCAQLLISYLEQDLREILYPTPEQSEKAARQIRETRWAQPAMFVIEYALAQMWIEWGVEPSAMIGHSIGEYVAGCLAGVFSLEEALALVSARGRLMQGLPGGAMLSVALSAEEVGSWLDGDLSLAAINAPSQCVVSGPGEAIDSLQRRLTESGVGWRQLQTSHAFHSKMMEPICERFAAEIGRVELKEPKIRYISNLTGKWVEARQTCDPAYWVRQMREPVRFAEGIATLLKGEDSFFLEVGPGLTLTSFVRQQAGPGKGRVATNCLPGLGGRGSDQGLMLEALGRLWLAGVKVDWRGFYARERRRRLALPTYPFERKRYWIEAGQSRQSSDAHKAGALRKTDVSDWFYAPSWKRCESLAPLNPEKLDNKTTWLIFRDECGVGLRLARRLKEAAQDVIEVVVGDRFYRVSDSIYTIKPGQREDYVLLVKDLLGRGKTPEKIVHLWSVTRDDFRQEDFGFSGDIQQALRRSSAIVDSSFYSLLFLAQELSKSVSSPIQIAVVSNNLQEVTGDEHLCPEKATLIGPCKVIRQECQNISCRSIDIVLPQLETQEELKLIDKLILEILSNTDDLEVAYRGKRRWIRTYEPVKFEGASGLNSRLRKGGVYMITGGLGRIGLTLAGYLARASQGKLVLVGRSDFPQKENWKQWLDEHGEDDETSRRIRKLEEIEKLGARVEVVRADVTDEEQMLKVVTRTRETFGDIQGVIHSEGVAGEGMIYMRSPEAASEALSPKVKGARVLESIFKETNLDFMVLCSSQVSILGGVGGVDYCAANAFLDSFARYYSSNRGAFATSINWCAWRDTGMPVNSAARYRAKEAEGFELVEIEGFAEKRIEDPAMQLKTWMSPTSDEQKPPILARDHYDIALSGAISPEEGEKAFSLILSDCHLPQIIVSPRDLQTDIDQVKNTQISQVSQELNDVASSSKSLYPRPAMETPYAEAGSEIERLIVGIWQELLGIDSIGVHDSFFELGGHSLIATQMISRLNKTFRIVLPIASIFEDLTIAGLAKHIRAISWAAQGVEVLSVATESQQEVGEL
jgi:acyl transferase domain-containing protein/acyl carrier protein